MSRDPKLYLTMRKDLVSHQYNHIKHRESTNRKIEQLKINSHDFFIPTHFEYCIEKFSPK